MSPNTDRTVLEGPMTNDQKFARRVRFQSSDSSEDLRRAIELSLQDHQQPIHCPADSSDGTNFSSTAAAAGTSLPVAPSSPPTRVYGRGATGEDGVIKPKQTAAGVSSAERRENDWPVGLVNVGNSCWFNAVVQPLFHLPYFRHLLMHHDPFQQEEQTTEHSAKQCIVELQRVFALLLASWRRHVDPVRAVQLFRAQFDGSAVGGASAACDRQQDVSEFLHKLLDWLEQSFQQQLPRSAHEDGTSGRNVMASLFYGHLTSERLREGKKVSCVETFGQFPLAVSADSDLHSALERSMLTWQGDSMSGQWFSTLPPVLILQLSRFKFNQRLECTEKLHDRLSFPEQIYMDRYLYRNREVITCKRSALERLKRQRVLLQRRLDSFKSFGDTAPRLPLPSLLRHTLSYVRADGSTVHTDRSHSSSSYLLKDTCCNQAASTDTRSVEQHSLMATSMRQGDFPPAKKTALGSSEELRTVERCLSRWVEEVENEMVALKSQLDQIDCQTATMFDDCSLRKAPYRLHAVLVHEGQAVSGHYWAYVYNQQRQCWIKLNDVNVTASTWQQVCSDSAGGSGTTSAYCLIYYDSNRHDLFHECGGGQSEMSDCGDVEGAGDVLSLLPDWLRRYVDQDNQRLMAERSHLSPRQQQKQNVSAGVSDSEPALPELIDHGTSAESDSEDPSGDNSSSACGSGEGPADPAPSGSDEVSGVNLEHAELQLNCSMAVLRSVLVKDGVQCPSQTLVKALRCEMDRVKQLCGVCVRGMDAIVSGAETDPRLSSFAVYLLCNLADVACYVQWALLEQMAHPELSTDSSVLPVHRQAVKELRVFVKKRSASELHHYALWHTWYATFRRTNWLVLQVLDHYFQQQYDCAVQCSVQACRLSEHLCKNREQLATRLSVSPQLLLQLRRKSIQCLNESELKLFGNGKLQLVQQQVERVLVPALAELERSANSDDRSLVEQVKQSWCDLISQQMNENTRQMYQVVLNKLVEPAASVDDTLLKIRRVEKERELADKLRQRLAQFRQLI